jgi:hypothetical protein
VTKIDNFPQVTFKIGNGETKNDHTWLKKKKEIYEKIWIKDSFKTLRKIEDTCGYPFPEKSKQEGIAVQLHKKTPKNQTSGLLSEDNPLEINLYLTKNDTANTLKELLVRMLVYSFIQQQYEFHFRMREQILFEDILADEFISSMIGLTVLGRKLSRASSAEALGQAIEATVCRLSQKSTKNKLVDMLYSFQQENPAKTKKHGKDVLAAREELVSKLLEFLPKSVTKDIE